MASRVREQLAIGRMNGSIVLARIIFVITYSLSRGIVLQQLQEFPRHDWSVVFK
jgi:hypothetical protein